MISIDIGPSEDGQERERKVMTMGEIHLTESKRARILDNLTFVYGEEKAHKTYEAIADMLEDVQAKPAKQWVDEQDVMLITYGDSIREEGESPLSSLHRFLNDNMKDKLTNVHLLPFYPYSSDDGFSVIDYEQVDPALGNWSDILKLHEDYHLMFDAVINHISQESEWFQQYLKGDPAFASYFIEADPNEDYRSVTRPRALPLLTPFETANGLKHIWTTFSDDQIDLNYENEQVLLHILRILLMYVDRGARFLRLDAIGFMWKKLGTTSIHLEEAHRLIQVMRDVLESAAPGTILITETNVPHKENISYFGNGHNEAHMVYQFPLPPLTLHALQTGRARKLSEWADSLEPTTAETSFFNFLASHDGIGVRPVEGLLTKEEVQAMVDKVQQHGGFVSYKDNGDGTKSPYELNINYMDALSAPEEQQDMRVARFMAAQSILLSMQGVPGIYIHSLLGSQNDLEGVKKTGRNRSINREKLERKAVQAELDREGSLRHDVFTSFQKLIAMRQGSKAFHPNGEQKVLMLDDRVFSLLRTSPDRDEAVAVLINVSDEQVTLERSAQELGLTASETATDLMTGNVVECGADRISLTLEPYQVMWLNQ
ncbi:alpha-amylase family glycosyl hydrolase [Marinicrinis sediminis]|uniref:Sucrose phosphorylase n=1 Tax=Marinicrinis sediminis TaxID=1652465 RepID=A0ABW5R6T0_9BACL